MSATIAAARACARTLLFHSLRLHAFRGAVPHVMLVVDATPCVQQKVLVEGYLQVLAQYNAQPGSLECVEMDDTHGVVEDEAMRRAGAGTLFISLAADTVAPCGSIGLTHAHANASDDAPPPISCSVIPFDAATFLDDMRLLQAFLRQCGQCDKSHSLGTAASDNDGGKTAEGSTEVWSEAVFREKFGAVAKYLEPLDASPSTAHTAMSGDALRHGPRRELLGFVLMQRSAFQNEMKRYRLRLSLFDMGTRVAEHCHLESMSEPADALAAQGDVVAALQDDQVYSYPRSCSLRPHIVERFARAIADAIDVHAWRRSASLTHSAIPIPPSFLAALQDKAIWALFRRGALVWEGVTSHHDADAIRKANEEDYQHYMASPVCGPGAPLRITCRDASKVLTFTGGLEDCLMNTGFYVASEEAERNAVGPHRARFHLHESTTATRAAEHHLSEAGAINAPTASGPEVHGRLKKQEYLALKRQRKAAAAAASHSRNALSDDEDDDEGTRRAGPVAGSRIASSIGGTFPIGEVISEAFDLSALHGTCDVFAYPDPLKNVAMAKPRPFTMTIEKGVVTAVSDNAPDDFMDLLSLVRQVEGACYVRELGIGLNPFVGLQHILLDVTSFERQWGIHLSLGQRHPLFVKQRAKRNADGTVADGVTIEGPVLKRKAGRYHIDVFVDATTLQIGSFTMDFTKGLVVA